MNIKEIKDMITLMNENELVELEIEKDGLKLRLKKGISGVHQEFSVLPKTQVATPSTVGASTVGIKEAEIVAKASLEIKSPMVGTFYRTPAPDTAPYVQEGQEIGVGQVVCIIEAMKLMNEIKSEIKGRIAEILVDNAEPVEFGQPMFLIEPL